MRAATATAFVISFVAAAFSAPAAPAAEHKCGQTPIKPNLDAAISGRIGNAVIGGSPVVGGSWPWTVAICHADWFGTCTFKAAGAIIGDRWVLSTYSALSEFGSAYRVRAGVLNQTDRGEQFEQFIPVHMSYFLGPADATTHYNDIAVIELAWPFRFNDHVQPICLPSSDEAETAPGQSAWFAGWGHLQSSTDPVIQQLHQAELLINNPAVCKNNNQSFWEVQQLCVGDSPAKTTCNDDRGGPLMAQREDGAWYLLGLSSATAADYNGACNTPTAFTRVSYFCPFIFDESRVKCI